MLTSVVELHWRQPEFISSEFVDHRHQERGRHLVQRRTGGQGVEGERAASVDVVVGLEEGLAGADRGRQQRRTQVPVRPQCVHVHRHQGKSTCELRPKFRLPTLVWGLEPAPRHSAQRTLSKTLLFIMLSVGMLCVACFTVMLIVVAPWSQPYYVLYYSLRL